MRIKIAIPLNLLLAALVLWSWLTMFTGYDTGTMLTAARLRSLKYFTLDSNLLAAATALIAAYYELFRGGTLPVWVRSLKLAGAASVAVTFLTVAVYLGPRYGYRSMFAGVNLHLHLTAPLLAIGIFCFLEGSHALSFRHTFTAVIPLLIYAACYLGNILINGIGTGPNTNDWYGLMYWGLSRAPLVFAVFAAAGWILTVILWACGRFTWSGSAPTYISGSGT